MAVFKLLAAAAGTGGVPADLLAVVANWFHGFVCRLGAAATAAHLLLTHFRFDGLECGLRRIVGRRGDLPQVTDEIGTRFFDTEDERRHLFGNPPPHLLEGPHTLSF